VAAIEPSALREKLERRLSGMKREREPWDVAVREVATYAQPSRSRFLSEDVNKGPRFNTKLLDSRAIWASDVLAAGMTSGMSSPSRPWFKLEPADPEMKERQAVKEWLKLVSDRIYDLFSRTNFYAGVKSGYQEMGLFGSEATIMVESARSGAVCHSMTFGEYWLAIGDDLTPNTLYRRCDMTVIQLMSRFGRTPEGRARISSATRTLYDNGEYDKWVECYHAVEPNDEREIGKADRSNMAFRSLYWEAKTDQRVVLDFGGYEEQPFWAPRWDVTGSDTYSTTCPGFRSLPDDRQLQIQHLRKTQAVDLMNRPPLVGPTSLQNVHIALAPGGITFASQIDKDAFRPVYQVQPDISALREDINETRNQVAEAFYADLFMAITNMEGIQPRNVEEIASRNDEKLTQLGPVVDRTANEKLKPAIDRAYNILERGGMIPPAPEELQGAPLKVVFVSVLAQLQRAAGLRSIERAAAFVGNLAAAYPDVADKFDADQAVDEYTDLIGVAPSIIRPDDQVAKIREARERAAAAQKQAEMAAMAAPAANQGAQAAELLSRTDAPGGGNMLERLVGAA
jgi:hypothetical protein